MHTQVSVERLNAVVRLLLLAIRLGIALRGLVHRAPRRRLVLKRLPLGLPRARLEQRRRVVRHDAVGPLALTAQHLPQLGNAERA